MITREQVADLRPGDIVSISSERWSPGTELGGPLWDDGGVLRCGPITVRYSDGYTAQNADWNLYVVSRAPRPFYSNHPRTEPKRGDVAAAPEGDGGPWLKGNGDTWYSPSGKTLGPLPAGFRLLVDGTTGEVVQ